MKTALNVQSGTESRGSYDVDVIGLSESQEVQTNCALVSVAG